MKLRRSTAFLGVIALVLGVAMGGAWAANPFTDIAGNTHASNIDAIYNAGITAGCAQGPTFYCPTDNVTRAQMASFLARLGGLSSGATLNLPKANGRSEKQVYCALADRRPRSFDEAPCRGFTNRFSSAANDGISSAIAVGTDGYPVIAYRDSTNGDLRMLHCTSANCATANNSIALDTTSDASDIAMTIGTDGFPVLSYWATATNDLKVLHCTHTACATADPPVTPDDFGDVGAGSSIAIANDGFPIVSYRDMTTSDLYLVRCTNVACSAWASPLVLDGLDAAAIVGTTSIAIGTDRIPIISYYDTTNDDLKVVRCTNASCSEGDVPIILDNGAGDAVGTSSSLAIGIDGLPIVSYRDATSTSLKVVHCADAACTSRDAPVTVDNEDDVGGGTAIAIGTNGFATVAYFDNTNSALKVVRCSSHSCAAHDAPVVADNTGIVGVQPDMAIGFDGVPIISHWDGGNEDLRVTQPAVA